MGKQELDWDRFAFGVFFSLFFSLQFAFCKVKVNIRFLVAEFLALFRFHFSLYADERVCMCVCVRTVLCADVGKANISLQFWAYKVFGQVDKRPAVALNKSWTCRLSNEMGWLARAFCE